MSGTINNQSNYVFIPPPQNAGCWVIGGTWHVYIREKPTDEQIKNTEQMFGWKWKDENDCKRTG